ncbi:MAG: glycogen synthase GlgA [Candidatus Firestonebacteria bacterium]|nr:glycogen synthase GlgA [Candidatus Firestonebacteria bacterium]
MKILFPVSEAVPFAKTGGLADVAGTLPQALARLGHEVYTVLPLYRHVRNTGVGLNSTRLKLSVPLGNQVLSAEVWEAQTPSNGVHQYFIQYDPFFDRAELYHNAEGDYRDNDQRFTFFCRAVMELGITLGQSWDIIHCHDWHTGLIPVYLKTLYAHETVYRHCRSVITIHNLAYQGLFPRESMSYTGLPDSLFSAEGVEFWGRLNFLKSGLIFADWINTVSPTYAREIQTAELGHGLDGVLRQRKHELSGILNGLDYTIWNPQNDPFLPIHFQPHELERKQELKAELMEEQRIFAIKDAPLVGMISRLDEQKGLDILAEAAETLLNLNMHLIILGTGTRKFHEYFLHLKSKFARKLAVNLAFNNELAHRIYAASDMFLMPSRFEPCGLGQLIAMRYGTIPIVRHTGGLADTVIEFDGKQGNGFCFQEYSGHALVNAARRAFDLYQDKDAWQKVVHNAMQADFSWERAAGEYHVLYHRLREAAAATPGA